MKYVKWFDTLTMKDVPLVGGKNASLGQMIGGLKGKITIPNGFAVTSEAYWLFIEHNNFEQPLKQLLAKLKKENVQSLQKTGRAIRALLKSGAVPEELQQEIIDAYKTLCKEARSSNCSVAIRSSATAEDLPNASFAGQQETFLNVTGTRQLLECYVKAIASLFTDRAISYRMEKGFDHLDVALSVGVQRMIRSKVSGVAFSLDTQTGFKNVITIDASYGLGETIVKGLVSPDEYIVFKPTLTTASNPIIQKKLGDKTIQMVYSKSARKPTKKIPVSQKDKNRFCLNDEQIITLAKMVEAIDQYYTKLHKKWMPMDVEWALDDRLYIVQARPETVHSQKDALKITKYALEKKPKKPLITGVAIGQQIVSGKARVVTKNSQMHQVKDGEILVTRMTDPDWVPIMKKVGGIITDLGGRTCHAAIVSRELSTPALVGTEHATRVIKNGQQITVDCSSGAIGFVYQGAIPFKKKEINIKKVPKSPVSLMVNIGNPESAFQVSQLPVDGVGLARLEFIISSAIKIHPMALLEPRKIKDKKVRDTIKQLTRGYKDKKQFFIDTLAYGMGTIAAAFYPRPVIIRLSDFKTNEYRNLIGGSYFEQEEENPMLGFRGAARYTHPLYQEAFALECAALQKVRRDMGLDNVKVMIPFVRTMQEAQKVIKELAKNGIRKGKNNLELVMMCEVPSNVLLINEFSTLFDGFSIGSNDLAQLTLGVDRDSALLADLFDERNPAVTQMFALAIKGAHKSKRFIGICGQAPSDYPELARFLIKQKIDSLSLNPDSVLPFLLAYKKK